MKEIFNYQAHFIPKKGKKSRLLKLYNDGMGAFEYTPSALPAIAKVNFQGKQYEFTLPKALAKRVYSESRQ